MFKDKKDFFLVSPDGGALKKIYKLAEKVDCLGVIECSKNRNIKTGEITTTKVYTDGRSVDGKDCYIVDDICDGGRTFIEIAKELKSLTQTKLY
jgi:Phosphoribosylpyrophosphate synthetase